MRAWRALVGHLAIGCGAFVRCGVRLRRGKQVCPGKEQAGEKQYVGAETFHAMILILGHARTPKVGSLELDVVLFGGKADGDRTLADIDHARNTHRCLHERDIAFLAGLGQLGVAGQLG